MKKKLEQNQVWLEECSLSFSGFDAILSFKGHLKVVSDHLMEFIFGKNVCRRLEVKLIDHFIKVFFFLIEKAD
jgi:hypothetical protein